MAVSQRYIEYLELIKSKRNFSEYEIDHLISELRFNWEYIQTKYSIYKLGFGTYQESIKHTLFELAEIGYELLFQLQNYELSFENIIEGAKELHRTKNAGYSGDADDAWKNFRECTKFGISAADGCLVRLCDKYSRFFSVYTNPNNDKVGESAIDTLIDFSAYSLILMILMEEEC